MLTDEQIEILGDKLIPLYQQLEADTIADIVRRIKKTGRYTETAELQVKALMEKGYSPSKIQSEVMKLLRADKAYQMAVAENTKEYKAQVAKAIKETVDEAKRQGDKIIAEAGTMSFNTDLALWKQAGKKLDKPNTFWQLVTAMTVQTNKELKNLTRTTGFKSIRGFTAIQDVYQKQLDLAIVKLTSGAYSYDQCVVDCVKELSQSGLRSIDYASGRSYQLDTASRLCTRTASAQLSAKISIANAENSGEDLVEVSSHFGARPEHAVWQGKIYSRSGKSKKYPNFSVCRYGAVDGLCGANCRHTFYTFFDGYSKPTKWAKEPEPTTWKGKSYTYTEATQKQRYMERNIRQTKREIEATNSIQESTTDLRSKLKAQRNEYHSFSNSCGIRAKENRLRYISGSSNK